jgi:hypothetical protein
VDDKEPWRRLLDGVELPPRPRRTTIRVLRNQAIDSDAFARLILSGYKLASVNVNTFRSIDLHFERPDGAPLGPAGPLGGLK